MFLPNVRFTMAPGAQAPHGAHGTASPSDHVGPEGFPEWRVTLHEVGFVSRSFSIGEARLSDLPERIGDHLGGARIRVEGVQ